MPASSRSTIAALVPPALLAALLPGGCGRSPSAAERLALDFPQQAAAVLGAPSSRFVESAAGFAAGSDGATIHVDLPRDASAPIAVRAAGGPAFEMREVGAEGAGALADHAVVYARQGVTTFWSIGASSAEEWIHVDAGVARRDAPLLAWEIAGASLRQHGAEVEVTSDRSLAKVRVSAPAAYSRDGRSVQASLRVVGSTIELFVDAEGDALLVDPMWVAAMPMAGPRYYHAAARLQSGKVLVCGGSLGLSGNELSTSELYDPAADQWSDAGMMASTRANHTATTLPDGTVLVVAGSINSGAAVIAGTEVYDPVNGWSTKPSIPNSRSNHTATLLDTGKVLVAGGFGGSGNPVSISDSEIYDPNMAGGGWSFTDAMFSARGRHTATELQDHRVLVAGGNTFGAASATAEIYDDTTGHWTKTATNMNVARENHGAALLGDGTVLVVGGDDAAAPTPNPLASAEIYDPVANTWTAIAPLPSPRTSHTTTLLADGTVLVAGGEDAVSSLSTAEIYDPAMEMWSAAPDMITARSDHTATRLTDGRVLVAGGDNSGGDIALAELYEPGGAACMMDPDCPMDEWCNVDTCAPKKADGAKAPSGDECTSGFAQDGVCCDKACDGGPCEVCSMAAGATKDGECTEVASKCDDGNPCTADTCTSGVCQSLSLLDGTRCQGGVCIAGVCLLDISAGATSASASSGAGGGSSGSTSGAGGGGGSGGGTETATGELVGGGCSAASTAPRSALFAGGVFALLAAAWRRRRQARAR